MVITPSDQKMPLWERLPITWRGMAIWIKRKPVEDKKKVKESA